MKTKEIDTLIKVLKKHGVEYFKTNEIELKLSGLSAIKPIQDKNLDGKSKKEITEDDLYYSASTWKVK